MGTPDTNDRTVQCVLECRGRSLAAGGAVSSQDRAFRYAGSQVSGAGRGNPVSGFGGNHS